MRPIISGICPRAEGGKTTKTTTTTTKWMRPRAKKEPPLFAKTSRAHQRERAGRADQAYLKLDLVGESIQKGSREPVQHQSAKEEEEEEAHLIVN